MSRLVRFPGSVERDPAIGALILIEAPDWRTAALLVFVIWGSARLYYFMFYVIERYIDP